MSGREPRGQARAPEHGAVLEANLVRLLARHRQLHAAPAFRLRLAALLAARLVELGPAASRREPRRALPRLVPLAATVLFALGAFLAWRATRSEAPPEHGTALADLRPPRELPSLDSPSGAGAGSASEPGSELVSAPVDERVALASRAEPETRGALAEEPEELPLLEGRVLTEGRPLESFRIVLLEEVRLPSVAEPRVYHFPRAADGRFALSSGLRPGRYALFVLGEELAVLRAGSFELGRGERPALELELGRGLSLSGRVVERGSGRPLENAVVLSEKDLPHQVLAFDHELPDPTVPAATRSGPDGRFELRHLSSGAHVLRVTAAGHAAAWTSPLEAGSGRELSIELGPPARLTGIVLDETGAPRAGAQLVASRIDYSFQSGVMSYGYALSGPDGRFALEDLAGGHYVVLDPSAALGAGGPPRVRSVTLTEGRTLEICLPECRETTKVRGRLLDFERGPVADRDLVLFAAEDEQRFVSARTGADGGFELELAPGAWLAFQGARIGQDMLLAGRLEVPPVALLEQDLVLGPGEVRGRVVRAEDGAPLAEAWLVLSRSELASTPASFAGKLQTDARGEFRFDGLEEGLYELAAHAAGCAPLRLESLVVSRARESSALLVALEPGGALAVRVLDPRGEPLAGCPLVFVGPDGSTWDFGPLALSDGQGRVRIDGLSPGRWRVRAGTKDALLEREVTIEVGRTSELELAPTAPQPGPEGAATPR